jgi:hypothetical protein
MGFGTGERTHGSGKSTGGDALLRGRRPVQENEGRDGGVGGSFWTAQRENKGRGGPGLVRYAEGNRRGSGGVAQARKRALAAGSGQAWWG